MSVRIDYGQHELTADHLDPDPLTQLQSWLDTAAQTDQLAEPSAMALATVDPDGQPALRTVLLRRIAQGRLLFFTNYGSRKADHLAGNPFVAGLFRWANPARQVEVRGRVARATPQESDDYFASRPRGSQIGAHVSPQSRPLADRATLDHMVEEVTARFNGLEVPRPDDWGGYAITPSSFEFWQGRTSRLHDRFTYVAGPQGAWTIQRLAP
ncbi:MAG: pyridoxamine 5'-phosphate oxidase [Euzebya sp.]